jgi:hypothetical protein
MARRSPELKAPAARALSLGKFQGESSAAWLGGPIEAFIASGTTTGDS